MINTTSYPRSRSVGDYPAKELIHRALSAEPERSIKPHIGANHHACSANDATDFHQSNDWVFERYDSDTTEAQSMMEELQRLQVLKSYMILDSDREEAFERITRTASKHFRTPIALVSLIDLGRQWFMSNRGLPVRETPRKHAFCAHAIKQKVTKCQNDGGETNDANQPPVYPLFIIPDATLDFRFKDNPLVTGPPNIRFYAGAPLISPEGYRLGTLCVIDTKPRPEGLNDDQQATLRDLAAIVMQTMVDRRHRVEGSCGQSQKLIAYTAHDLLTPLTGLQLSLAMMKEDDVMMHKIGSQGQELLSTATSCADIMLRICRTSVDGLRERFSKTDTSSSANCTSEVPITRIDDLLSSLRTIMDPIQKKVPIVITVDESVPGCVVADDLKLFRSALNLLSNAASRTTSGNGWIHLKIFTEMDGLQHNQKQYGCVEPILIFECEDTGTDIDTKDTVDDHEPSGVLDSQIGLSSIASLVRLMHGECGCRPRSIRIDDDVPLYSKNRSYRGAIFWFWIPLKTPETFVVEQESLNSAGNNAFRCRDNDILRSKSCSDMEQVDRDLCLSYGILKNRQVVEVDNKEQAVAINWENDILRSLRSKSCSDMELFDSDLCLSYGNLKNRQVVEVDNKEQADAINLSCLRAALTPSISTKQRSRRTLNMHPSQNHLTFDTPNESTDLKEENGKSICSPRQNENRQSLRNSMTSKAVEQWDNNISSQSEVLGRLNAVSSPANDCLNVSQMTAASKEFQTTNHNITAVVESNSSRRLRRALIIDDCGIIRKTLSRALTKQGFDKVVLALDGMEGLRELQKETFDIVLCDFLMPVMDGLDCVKQYRRWEQDNRPWFKQPIIGMSAHASVNNKEQGIDTGMDNFMPKPVTMKALLEIKASDLCRARSEQLDKMECHPIETNDLEKVSAQKCYELQPKIITLNGNISMKNSTCQKQMNDDDVSLLTSGKREGSKISRACLMVTDSPLLQSSISRTLLELMGWVVVVANDGASALKSLQMRNWDVVLVDDDISDVNGQSCISVFRQWEESNRINGQKNVFLVCAGQIPSPRDLSSVVQPPSGCNGVLRKPVDWDDLSYIIDRSCEEKAMEIVM